MSFGFTVSSAAGQTSISSESYNMVYAGRGSLYRSGNAAPNTNSAYATLGVDGFSLNYYDFYIEVSAVTAVIPFFRCSGYCAISFVRQASATRWEIELFATALPTVYCFTRIPPSTAVNGDGLAVYRSDGGVSYLSTQPHLIANAVAEVQSYGSNVSFYGSTSGLQTYAAEPAARVTAVGGAGLTTPIIHYATGNSAAYYNRRTYTQNFFARAALFSAGNVYVRWGNTAYYSAFNNTVEYGAPADSNVVIVAEGAYF